MNKRKVCVVTGSRAEYGLFYPILSKIQASNKLELQLISTSSHHSSEYGLTYKQIESDGFNIVDKIENLYLTDTKPSIVKSTGLATSLLSDSFDRLQPDVVLLLGDRYETHAAATAAMLMNIPIAHIHGGEITEGAVDEQIRHSITKMSYLHFCATETYRQRVIQMGEDPARVFNSGAPGIDNIINLNLLTKKILEKELSWKFTSKSALFTYHPVTLEENDIAHDLEVILSILETFSFNILFTYANADAGGRVINQKMEQFCKIQPAKYKVVKSLGQVKYLSAMKYVDLLIGNTSSGIIEAASFKKPVVNIGDRQKGRLRGENVIDCNLNTLQESIKLALSNSFRNKIKNMNNIYGTGSAADFIVDKLTNEPISVIKKFRDQH
jgi:UDP-N-acetylglucosamine 2-epimerase (non-hydrolysing)/GDP/UDP-N,N'-diacetylbacillosamine 2-epimerase (hydrolysing)